MASKPRRIQRLPRTGNAALDDFLDELADQVYQTQVRLTLTQSEVAAVGTLPDVNTGITALSKGDLWGRDSNGKVKRALATSASGTTVIASAVCTQNSPVNEPLYFTVAGLVDLRVESGVVVAEGDFAYVSDTQAGSATNSKPSSMQIVGRFTGPKNSRTNTAPAIVIVIPRFSRTV